jgi:hypothetical protein
MEMSRRDKESALSALLRKARSEAGLTQGEVARRVTEDAGRDLKQSKVSDHEHGRWGKGHIEDFAGPYGRVLGIEDQIVALLWPDPNAPRPPIPRAPAGDSPATEDENSMIEMTVRIGALDWSVTVKAPTVDADVVQRQVAELMARAIRETSERGTVVEEDPNVLDQ